MQLEEEEGIMAACHGTVPRVRPITVTLPGNFVDMSKSSKHNLSFTRLLSLSSFSVVFSASSIRK